GARSRGRRGLGRLGRARTREARREAEPAAQADRRGRHAAGARSVSVRQTSRRPAGASFMKVLVIAQAVLAAAATAAAGAAIEGRPAVWQPMAVAFVGPVARAADTAPNPFLDVRLQVAFTGPSGRRYSVAGFFDGDGGG